MDIDVGSLSDCGFLFLWVINSQVPFAIKCMKKWGYTFIDRVSLLYFYPFSVTIRLTYFIYQITWIKKTQNNNVAISQGYYFLHSSELCLIGVKCNSTTQNLEFISKVYKALPFLPPPLSPIIEISSTCQTTNDLLFAELREKSRKPDQMYHIIERMVPGNILSPKRNTSKSGL